jgi:FkbM family methyltransferase
MFKTNSGSEFLRGASLRTRCARFFQRALLRGGIWVTPLDRFKREVAQIAYRDGGFSFIQIGANDGVSFDDFFWLVTHFNGYGLTIEPMADAYERLVHNYRPYSGVVPLRMAVHPTLSDIKVFRVAVSELESVPPWAYGSASMDPSWLPRQGVDSELLESEACPAMHLMSVIEQYQIRDLNVLQIDAEGFDLEVIKMLDFSRLRPDLIRFEMPQGHNQEDMREAELVIRSLQQNGYKVLREGMDALAIKK